MSLLKHHTIRLLIAANLIPLFGVIMLGYDVYTLLVLYWAETAVIGFYTLMKLGFSMGDISKLQKLAIFPLFVGIFLLHFGFFLYFSIEGFTLFFGPVDRTSVELPSTFPIIKTALAMVWIPLIGFLISHGYSFYQNYIMKGEYGIMNVNDVMAQPYKRVYLMFIVMFFGGVLSIVLHEIFAAVLFVCMKIFFDVLAHKKEHKLQ